MPFLDFSFFPLSYHFIISLSDFSFFHFSIFLFFYFFIFLFFVFYFFVFPFFRLVSGSDDFTLFMWTPAEDKKPICRMTGRLILT